MDYALGPSQFYDGDERTCVFQPAASQLVLALFIVLGLVLTRFDVYFGMMSAELVRGHPPEHPEGKMHGGVPVGENYLTVAVFDNKTGRRIADVEVTARVSSTRGLDVQNVSSRWSSQAASPTATTSPCRVLGRTELTCVSACQA